MGACRPQREERRRLFAHTVLTFLVLTAAAAPPDLLAQTAPQVQPQFQPQTLPQPLADELQRSQLPASAFAVMVTPLDGGGPSLLYNADTPMNPASTMKLVTSYSALELLGEAFVYHTVAYALGPIEGEVLRGDVTIKGSGDPHFTEEDLFSLLRQLRQRGVRTITGNILIDRSLYAPMSADPGQFDGEPYRAYNVAPDAFLVNFDATTLTFLPDPAHQRVITLTDPPLDDQSVGTPRLGAGGCGDWRSGLGLDLSNPQRIAFTGSYPASCGEKSVNVSFEPAGRYSASLVASVWRELGGKLLGRVQDGPVASGSRIVAEHESDPLAVLIYDMNKFSNNVMARSIFLTLSSEVLHVPASTDASARVVKGLLAQRSINTDGINLENGSGLSRRERISARQMGLMLESAFRGSTMAELMSSLPIVGSDGTMRNRLKSDAVTGHAHIKTGSLNDVRAVAGYVDAVSGRRYVVVCLVNDPGADRSRAFQDLLLSWVFDNG
jgi:D-alanyl-D-alanine carboxypeptidase/D-alanyl-D-alanine-endopeptidase (penicillin-binding protein 4)